MKKLLWIALLSFSTLTIFASIKEAKAEATTTEIVEVAKENVSTKSTVDLLLEEVDTRLTEQLGVEAKPTGNEKLGILISSTANEFWKTMKTRYEEAGEELGISVKVFEAASGTDREGQLDVLNTMIGMDFDAIILSPIDGTNLIPGIVEANNKGIKIINLGPGVDEAALKDAGGHLDAKITVHFEEQGEMCAKDMIKRIGTGEVAIIGGLEGAAQSVGRTNGAKAVFEETEGIDLVAVEPCDWDTNKAYEKTKDILTAHPDLKGIFSCNDNMAMSCIRALKEMNKEDVLVYGVDFISDAVKAIEDKEMMGTMTYSSAMYTKASEKLAVIMLSGVEFNKPIYLPLTLVTQDNIAEFDGWK